jgi:hypothetical protein
VARVTSLLAASFLLVQAAVPLILLARPAPRSTDFSWDMFSHSLSCTRVEARARPQGGEWGGVRLDLDFENWAQFVRVLVPARLDAYASHLCETLRSEMQRPVELRFVIECRDDRSGSTVSLVDPTRDYCSTTP